MKRAFSLIELSIVILIIGILIAGVTQGSRLVNMSKLSNARTLTQSSPVNSISGLSLWVEATSEKSFDAAEQEDGLTVSTWYDLNTQSTIKYNLTQTTAGSRPLYEDQGINSLPSVKFNGTSQFMDFTNTSVVVQTSYTIFIVEQPSKTTGTYNYFIAPKAGPCGLGTCFNMGHQDYVSGTYSVYLSHYTDYIGTGTAQISSLTYKANTPYLHSAYFSMGSTRKYFYNGYAGSSDTNATVQTGNANMSLGSAQGFTGGYYGGMVGEIIIFNRALKNEERWAVEKYLAQKWGIRSIAQQS